VNVPQIESETVAIPRDFMEARKRGGRNFGFRIANFEFRDLHIESLFRSNLRRGDRRNSKFAIRNPKFLLLAVASISLVILSIAASAQDPSPSPTPSSDEPKKANSRPADVVTLAAEPFDGASVEKMAAQCVALETAAGLIEIEMIPEIAPESVRNFLNLSATGALDTTTFSRVVKGFVIQGGNLSTSERWSVELAKRMSRKLPDEPGLVKHVRGIVSMARTDEPHSASTHFFILVGEASHLDAEFAAFGRVRKGIEVADVINSALTDGDKPLKPVRIHRAVVAACAK